MAPSPAGEGSVEKEGLFKSLRRSLSGSRLVSLEAGQTTVAGAADGAANATNATLAKPLAADDIRGTTADKSGATCSLCEVGFNFIVRRHRCRVCVRAVCGTCSKSKMLVQGYLQRQRVCAACVCAHLRRGGTDRTPLAAGVDGASASGEPEIPPFVMDIYAAADLPPASPSHSTRSSLSAPDGPASLSPQPASGFPPDAEDAVTAEEEEVVPAPVAPLLAAPVLAVRHEHKRPVQMGKELNPLAQPWFDTAAANGVAAPGTAARERGLADALGSTVDSRCGCCDDLWRLGLAARSDLLAEFSRCRGEGSGSGSGGDEFELVATHGASLRLLASAAMFWGGSAVRLRLEAEVKAPQDYVFLRLAALTGLGGPFDPVPEAMPCDTLTLDGGDGASGAELTVRCGYWPTHFAGVRRCAVLRFVTRGCNVPAVLPGHLGDTDVPGGSDDPRPAAAGEEAAMTAVAAAAVAAAAASAASTAARGAVRNDEPSSIVFTTVDHPILREWAMPGQEIEIYPCGIVLEGYQAPTSASVNPAPGASSAAAAAAAASAAEQDCTRLWMLVAWDSKGALQSMDKMAFLSERTERLEAVDRHLRTIEDDYRRENGLEPLQRDPSICAASTLGLGSADAAVAMLSLAPPQLSPLAAPAAAAAAAPGTSGGGAPGGGSQQTKPAPGVPHPLAANRTAPAPFANGSKLVRAEAPAVEASRLRHEAQEEAAVLRLRLRASDDDRLRLASELALTKAAAAARDANATAALAETERLLAVREIELATSQADVLALRDELEELRRQVAASAAEARRSLRPPSLGGNSITPKGGTPKGSGSGATESITPPDVPSSPAVAEPPVGGWDVPSPDALARRSREMGLRFARDTLTYSPDEEVLAFMLHLVQALRYDAPTKAAAAAAAAARGGSREADTGAWATSSGSRTPRRASAPADIAMPASAEVAAAAAAETPRLARAPSAPAMVTSSEPSQLPTQRFSGFGAFFNGLGRSDSLRPALSPPPTLVTEPELENSGRIANSDGGANDGGSGGENVSAGGLAGFTANSFGGDDSFGSDGTLDGLMGERVDRQASMDSVASESEWNQDVTPLGALLVRRALRSVEIANYLHWYLRLEAASAAHGALYRSILGSFEAALARASPAVAVTLSAAHAYISAVAKAHVQARELPGRRGRKTEYLQRMLTERRLTRIGGRASGGGGGDRVGVTLCAPLPLDPAVQVYGIEPSSAFIFPSAQYPCVIEFLVHCPDDYDTDTLAMATASGAAAGAAAAATAGTAGTGAAAAFTTPSATPQQPTTLRKSLSWGQDAPPESWAVAATAAATPTAAAMTPAGAPRDIKLWDQLSVLGSASSTRGSYLAVFKTGDDLRQDQLAMQMISLMDRKLKEAGLDLRLTPYRVLATGPRAGLVEFVRGSTPLSAVLQQSHDGAGTGVLGFLRHHRGDPLGPLGIARDALDTFVRSTAGYCVITYLLGVGDRHLDNIMLKTDGALFHIDFGYMFGKDPKLMPPPFRLTREMVEAMGGVGSAHYAVFKSLCCQAYRCLRRSARQFLNLLSLMVDAGIKDLADDPGATLQRVQERFRLDATDAEADRHFLGLVAQSLNALAPRVLEVMHSLAVAGR